MPDIIPLDMPASYWRGRAQSAHRSGNLDEAVVFYRAALRKQDDNGIRRELAQVYADMRSITSSDRLYLENLARDAGDTDSVYGLARNRSLTGDERGMADLLDLYLRLSPCGEQADRARDILWDLPREERAPRRMRRAQVLCDQAGDRIAHPGRCLEIARRSWRRGKTPQAAQLMAQASLRLERPDLALRYALAACRLDGRDLNARLLLASALRRKNLAYGCRSALRQAAALCSGAEETSVFCQAALSLDQGDLAVSQAEALLFSAPGSVDAMLLLAMTLRAAGQDEERAQALISQALSLDEDHPTPSLLRIEAEHGSAAPRRQALRALELLESALTREESGPMDEQTRREALLLLGSPLPSLPALALGLLIHHRDALGLRMALLESELSPMQYALVLHALEEMGEKLPCFARVGGRLCLLPQPARAPYDEDLHALVRRLLRTAREAVPVDVVAREVPRLWSRLPERMRRSCARSRGEVWPAAIAVYLAGSDAGGWMGRCRRPRQAARILTELKKRSRKPYEVY